MTLEEQDEDVLAAIGEWEDLDLEITLDSGACDHILDGGEAPGYDIKESEGSRRKQAYIVGNGHRIPNEGEMCLNLEAA